jgi:hypothetical protein
MRKKTIDRLLAQLRAEAAALQAKLEYNHYADYQAASQKAVELCDKMTKAKSEAEISRLYAEAKQWGVKADRALKKADSSIRNSTKWIEEIVLLESDARELSQLLHYRC